MAKSFIVLNVTELRRIGETKEVETVYQIQCKSTGGIVFTEVIKDADATSAAAAKVLGAKAERLDAVKSL